MDNLNTTTIGLGLAALGRPEYINIRDGKDIDKSETAFKEKAFQVLDFAYENGVHHFDTAPSYGKGEQFLSEWINKKQPQGALYSTKWGYTYVANWDLGFDGPQEIKEHSLAKLNEQWAVSKKALPNLKIHQIHSATLDSRVLENEAVLQRLLRLKQEHNIQIGITTSGIHQAETLQKAKEIQFNREPLFTSFQVTYNILEQAALSTLIRLREEGNTIIVKEALANGRVFANNAYPKYQGLYQKLQKLATKYQVGVDAIALRFCMDSLQPTMVLSGAANSHQLQENLKAHSFSLTPTEIANLSEEKVPANDYWNERKQMQWN